MGGVSACGENEERVLCCGLENLEANTVEEPDMGSRVI
jgi:hypothetical protein